MLRLDLQADGQVFAEGQYGTGHVHLQDVEENEEKAISQVVQEIQRLARNEVDKILLENISEPRCGFL